MSQNLKEKSLRSQVEAAQSGAGSSDTPADLSVFDGRILGALQAAADKKAFDLTILDLRGIATFTDFFIITNGQNRRQVQAISDGIVEQLKKQGTRAARVEGYQTAEWILIDYGDFVVHIFDDKARSFYDLERLWRESARIDVQPDQLAQIGSLKEEK